MLTRLFARLRIKTHHPKISPWTVTQVEIDSMNRQIASEIHSMALILSAQVSRVAKQSDVSVVRILLAADSAALRTSLAKAISRLKYRSAHTEVTATELARLERQMASKLVALSRKIDDRLNRLVRPSPHPAFSFFRLGGPNHA
jgi:hypothetical protein